MRRLMGWGRRLNGGSRGFSRLRFLTLMSRMIHLGGRRMRGLCLRPVM